MNSKNKSYTLLFASLIFTIILYVNYKGNIVNSLKKFSPQSESKQNQTNQKVSVFLLNKDKYNTKDNTDYFDLVSRETQREDIGTFAIESIILGPNDYEVQNQKLQSTFGSGKHAWFKPDAISSCANKNFTLSINDQKATVKFCKEIEFAGDNSGYIIQEQITKTLKQFETIKLVRVLDTNGNCINYMSGMSADQCYY